VILPKKLADALPPGLSALLGDAGPTPTKFTPYGKPRPEVLAAAAAIQAAGWRVTSIVRPSTPQLPAPNHAKGIALDAAPMIGGTGDFGPMTAALIVDVLREGIPNVGFDIVGEKDHFHIQLNNDDAYSIGILVSPGNVRWLLQLPL